MYNTPREIPVVFHNGSTYDYHFIIKGLAEEFKGDFECLGESKEKYITFSVPIKKEFRKESEEEYEKYNESEEKYSESEEESSEYEKFTKRT